MNPEWQAKVEFKLENHDKDLGSIADSLTSINNQMEKTNQILQTFALADERFNSRMDSMETRCTARVEKSEENVKRLHFRVEKLEGIVAKITWRVITVVVIAVVGLVVESKV